MALAETPLLKSASVRASTGRKRNTNDRVWHYGTIAVLIFMSIVMIAPFLWLVSSSLKSQVQIFQYPPDLLPNPIQWDNYSRALTYKPFGLYLRNTLIIAGLNVIAVVFTSSFVAYGFARMRFWGRDFWFGIVIATLFLPYAIMIVPQFIMFSRLGWVNTYLPLTVPLFFGGGAFNIFLIRQFFRTIPEELADAARIDGCTEFGIYWRIMMPLARPVLITVAIFTFLNAWNDLLGPIIYLRSPENFTVAAGLASFRSVQDVSWDLQLAASTAMILPVIVLFFFAQRYFVRGIVMTGIKG
ncbi:MAG TPA: carbohydrate ABC transporter permease [Aggregatilineales bacterium]|nr:carbohydrate ABC transporter permease [Aggregatilineales bacterium]